MSTKVETIPLLVHAIAIRDIGDHLLEVLEHGGDADDIRAYAKRLRERFADVIGPEQEGDHHAVERAVREWAATAKKGSAT